MNNNITLFINLLSWEELIKNRKYLFFIIIIFIFIFF